MNAARTALSPGVRERVLAAARAEFAAHGLRAASVRSIGAGAGVTAAMINYYFGSKRALYDMVVEEAQGHLADCLGRAAAAGGDADLPARLTGAYFDFLSEEREFQRLLLREVLDEGDSLSAFVQRYMGPLRKLFEERFGRDEDTFQAAISLFGAVAGYFLYEPVLTELLGRDAAGAEALARRRQHVVELAATLSQRRK